MHHTRLLFIIVFAIFLGFLSALVVASNKLIIIPSLQKQPVENFVKQDPEKETKISTQLISKVMDTQENLNGISEKLDQQAENMDDLKNEVSTTAAQIAQLSSKKSVIAVEKATVGSFTTTSAGYTPMGLYVNIRCVASCYLWINFNTATRNQASPTSAAGYLNSYGLFVDSSDQSLSSEANLSVANMSVPVAVNGLVTVGAGTHTVEIRAKTSGGTLESRNSYLQVMALEK